MKGKLILDGYPVYEPRFENGHKPSTYRELKLALLEKYGKCYWCNTRVFDIIKEKGVKFPNNAATIDHLQQRPVRQKGAVTGKVLACNKCNEERASKKHRRDSTIYTSYIPVK